MANRHLFDDEKLTLTARLGSGPFSALRQRTVTWTFQLSGGAGRIADQSVDVARDAGSAVRKEVDLPKVKDGEHNYGLSYKVRLPGGTQDGADTYTIWPRGFELKVVHEVDGAEQPCPDFVFQVRARGNVSVDDKNLRPDATGVFAYRHHIRDIHTVEAMAPWQIEKWKPGKERGPHREVVVARRPFKVAFAWPEVADKPHEQFVNLPDDPGTDAGSKIRLRLAAEGDPKLDEAERTGVTGVPIHVQVTFLRENGKGLVRSKRNDPKPGILLVDGTRVDPDPQGVSRTQVQLDRDGGVADVTLELGYAGGDECEIKVGLTTACNDSTLRVVNWRKVGFRMFHPAPALSDFGKFDDAGLPAAVMQKTQKELDKIYVRYEKVSVATYDASIWPDVLPHCSVDGKLLGKGKGQKVLALEENQIKSVGQKLTPADKPGWQHVIVLADFINEKKQRTTATVKLTSAKKSVTLHKKDKAVFPIDVSGKYPGVSTLALKVSKLNGKAVTDAVASQADHPLREYLQGQGKVIWSLMDTLASLGDRYAEYLTFDDHAKITLTLPTGPGQPGALFAEHKGLELTATLQYEERDKESCMGMQLAATGGLTVFPVLHEGVKLDTLHTTIVHELYHAIDQAYGDPAQLTTSPPSHEIPGVPYRAAVPAGNAYDARGHQGGHCAYGLSASDKAETDFTCGFSARGVKMALKPKCINFGSDNLRSLTLCVECAETGRAQDLRDLGALT